jgi:hypothetical protein
VNVKRRKMRLDLDGRFDSRDRLVVPANPGLRVTEAGKQSGGIGRQVHRPAERAFCFVGTPKPGEQMTILLVQFAAA